jgi:hypothetical protein
MKHILIAIAFCMAATASCVRIGHAQQGFVTLAPEPSYYAWWLRAAFHPFETQVRGIPIQKIRSTWCKASEFRRDLFPPELELNDGLSFAVDGFFDGSNLKQTALVGAYESCAGAKGTFLLILRWPRQGSPTIRFIKEMPTDRQFAILEARPDSSIIVWSCMCCDSASRLKWDRSRGRFAWHNVAFY